MFAFLILGLGTVILLLPFKPHEEIIYFLFHPSWVLLSLGGGFCLIGILSLIFSLIQIKRSYYYIAIKGNNIAVDKQILLRSVEKYWKQQLKDSRVVTDIELKPDIIHLITHLPTFSTEDQKALVKKAEVDLPRLVREILDYRKELRLTISFADFSQ